MRLPVTASNPFKSSHYPGDIILWCVRWYLRFPISFAHMAEMALERGLLIHSSCIWRWVQIYGPELDKRCRAHLKRTNKSGSGVNGSVMKDHVMMRRFVSVEALFNGRHFDRQIILLCCQLVHKFQD